MRSSIQFYLFFSFIFQFLCTHCHLSSFRLPTEKREPSAALQHISGSMNVWTATKYSGSVVYSGLSPSSSSASLTSLFLRAIKGNEKAIWEGNWTNDDHHHHTRWLPKIFWLLWCSVLRPFYPSNVLLHDVLFIRGSLKKFIGSLSFLLTLFETKWWTNNATLSLKCLLRPGDE